MLLPLSVLTALNFTLPAMFASASADNDTVTTEPLTGIWMESAVIATGISSATAFPALSVALATISGGLVIAPPE